MKINPSNLNDTRSIRGFKQASAIMNRIDSLAEFTQAADQTEDDYQTAEDQVLLDSVKTNVPKPGNFGIVFESMSTGTYSATGDGSDFRAVLGRGSRGGEEVTRRETQDSVLYTVSDKHGIYNSGPSTTKIELNKESGEISYGKYWMGLIPARIDLGRF